MNLPEELLTRIEVVNRVLATERTLPAKLEAVVELLERTVPRCDSASVALTLESDTATTAAATGQLALEADLVQYRHRDGPCLWAVTHAKVVRIDMLDQDERFEHFAPGAIEAGVRSSLSIPLLWNGRVVGSFNLYSTTANAFSDELVTSLTPIADYAGLLIGSSPLFVYSLDLLRQLAFTVNERDRIATAIGVLSVRENTDDQAAWVSLQRRAIEEETSVGDMARRVVESLRPRGPASAEADDDGEPGAG